MSDLVTTSRDALAEQRGVALIAAERRRQIEVEGWTLEHDRDHGSSRLLRAAEAYEFGDTTLWPWGAEWWKPKDALSNLLRAGALYQAAADVSPGFVGAAKAGVERCASKIDAILGSPVVARMVAEAADAREAEVRAGIARVIEIERNFYARNSDAWDYLHAAAHIARSAALAPADNDGEASRG